MTSNHGGGITGGEIIEKESWRGRHLGRMWEASGRHLGSIWEASGRHLGGIWEASGTPGGHWAPRGSESQKSMPLSAKMQKLHQNVDFTLCL